MAIDWSALKPLPGLGSEVASISEMLGTFADRRRKQAQYEAEKAFQERQQAAVEANTLADNRRSDLIAEQARQAHADLVAHQTAQATALARTEQVKREDARFPDIQKAYLAQDPAAAHSIISHLGGTAEPYKPELLDVPPPVPKPDLVPESRGLGIFNLPSAALNAGMTKNYDTQTAQAQAVTNANDMLTKRAEGTYRVQLPASPETFMSTSAEAEARLNRGALERKAYDAMASTLSDDVYEKRFFEQLKPAVTSGMMTAKEAIDKARTSAYQTERMDITNENSRILAGQRKDQIDASKAARTRTMNQNAYKQLSADVTKFGTQTHLPDLTKRFEEASLAEKLLDSSGPAQKTAMDKLITAGRGASATGQFLKYMNTNMAGAWNGLMNTLEAYSSGGLGEGSKGAVRQAIRDMKELIRSEGVESARTGYLEKFASPSGEYQDFMTNVDNEYNARFARPFGYPLLHRKGGRSMSATGQVLSPAAAATQPAAASAPLPAPARPIVPGGTSATGSPTGSPTEDEAAWEELRQMQAEIRRLREGHK